jgi:hypothetical protein
MHFMDPVQNKAAVPQERQHSVLQGIIGEYLNSDSKLSIEDDFFSGRKCCTSRRERTFGIPEDPTGDNRNPWSVDRRQKRKSTAA